MNRSSTDKSRRAYISSRFLLELDGIDVVGTLQSIEGGALKSAGVADEKVGREGLVTRFPGRPKYEDFTIQVGMSMAPRFWEWIKASFNHRPQRKDGSIIALDYDNKSCWERKFTGALITEVGFPQLDAASKDAAYMTVKFAVEELKEVYSTSKKYPAEQEAKDEWQRHRLWLPANFAFKIDQFNDEAQISAKIDAFSVKQSVIECPTGGLLQTTKEPGRVEFPNLSVTVTQRDARPWMDWYDKLVRQGDHDGANEKNGHITYLGRDMDQGKPLLIVDIFGMGVTGVSPVKHDAKQEQIQMVKIDLYCESMDLDLAKVRGVVG